MVDPGRSADSAWVCPTIVTSIHKLRIFNTYHCFKVMQYTGMHLLQMDIRHSICLNLAQLQDISFLCSPMYTQIFGEISTPLCVDSVHQLPTTSSQGVQPGYLATCVIVCSQVMYSPVIIAQMSLLLKPCFHMFYMSVCMLPCAYVMYILVNIAQMGLQLKPYFHLFHMSLLHVHVHISINQNKPQHRRWFHSCISVCVI